MSNYHCKAYVSAAEASGVELRDSEGPCTYSITYFPKARTTTTKPKPPAPNLCVHGHLRLRTEVIGIWASQGGGLG